MEQPTEPYALAATEFADAVHAVVPVAGADQRQPVKPDIEAGIEATGAVLEQRAGRIGRDRGEEAVVFVGLQTLAFQERNHLVQHRRIGGCAHIVRDGVCQPRPIVRDARADALTRMRQPPMLDVALDELSRGRPQQVFARHVGPRGDQRHSVLQLVAEAVGTARLIEPRTSPDAARQRLIQQPAVQHDVHRTVRGRHLDRAQDSVPMTAYLR